jgi:RecA-family ATPase
LQALASELSVAIIVVHHTLKSNDQVDPFEKVSGSLGLSGAADAALILARDQNGVTLYGRGRELMEIEKAVVFDRETCRWRVQGEAAEVHRTDERKEILDVLKDADEPMSPSDLTAATGMQCSNLRQPLFKMAKAGEIVKVKRALYQHADNISPPGSRR